MSDVVLKGLNFADAYIDDVERDPPPLLTQHLFELHQVLERLRQYSLNARPSKCKITMKTVDVVGHRECGGSIEPRRALTQTILKYPRPETKKQVRYALGLLNRSIVRPLVFPPRGFSGLIYNALWGTLARLLVTQYTINFMEVKDAPVQIRLDHNTEDYVPYSYRTVNGFFNVPYYLISNKGYETGPPVYSPYPRRLESLTICRCNYKGSTFSSVILRP